MGIVFDEESRPRADSSEALPPPLAQLLALTRANTADVMERLMLAARTGDLPTEALAGSEYLLFICGEVACGIRLAALREILPALPQVVPLPSSPEWTLGVFALRTEILALIDPTPVLLEGPEEPASMGHSPAHFGTERVPESALIVGSGDRCLAWVISLVGDMVRLEDPDILPKAQVPETLSRKVRDRFISGYYISPRDGQCHTIVEADLVMEEALRALQEVSNG